MATREITPTQSRRLEPDRGRYTPRIDAGRGRGGWYYRLRFTNRYVDIPTKWTGPFASKDEAFAAATVRFNLMVQRIDGPDAQQFKQVLNPWEVARAEAQK
ncbi:MAG: hypothetical protein IT324_19555 [Anaerolineae bacterium]|nr:hypothetical protein [Anaerolineae bacterium]